MNSCTPATPRQEEWCGRLAPMCGTSTGPPERPPWWQGCPSRSAQGDGLRREPDPTGALQARHCGPTPNLWACRRCGDELHRGECSIERRCPALLRNQVSHRGRQENRLRDKLCLPLRPQDGGRQRLWTASGTSWCMSLSASWSLNTATSETRPSSPSRQENQWFQPHFQVYQDRSMEGHGTDKGQRETRRVQN